MQGDDAQITVTRARSKEQQARRVRLVEAARWLADEGGYAAVTMHDVADRAGVARATVYRYFASKDHLLTEVAADWARTVTADIVLAAGTEPSGGATPAQRLGDLLERIVEVAAADLTLTSTIIQAVTSPDPALEDARTELFLFVRARLAAVMGDPPPAQEEAEIVLGHVLLAALVSLTALRRPTEEVVAMVRTAARLILAGALS
ncbi:TetR/AcrR family transcriptional regulator [Actinomadura scrupuli]|uniref:TetR/AcrR family transcriptional regulator n=1 Tax=Actinomadura scrupuli TaxID=559629 RepID=UPI003D9737E4